MKNTTATKTETHTAKKPGIFSRIVDKLDRSMKEKAEEKAKKGQCCGTNSKGEKCC